MRWNHRRGEGTGLAVGSFACDTNEGRGRHDKTVGEGACAARHRSRARDDLGRAQVAIPVADRLAPVASPASLGTRT